MPDTSKMTPEQYAAFTGKMSYPAGHAEQVQERAPEPEPQKCPGCSSEPVIGCAIGQRRYVECRGECKMHGPLKDSLKEAIQVWNRITLKEPV